MEDYERQLDLERAVVNVTYRLKGVRYHRSYFASEPDGVLVVRLTADQPGQLTLAVNLMRRPLDSGCRPDGAGAIVMEGECGADGVRFSAAFRAVIQGGRQRVIGDYVSIEGADALTLLLAAQSTFRVQQPAEVCLDQLNKAAVRPYDTLLERHAKEYKSRFGRFALDLTPGGDPYASLPTDQRLLRLKSALERQSGEDTAADSLPASFDALKWVRTAKRAGLKYIIFTAKHHDGFTMYDSQVSDYSIAKHGAFGRDPLRELAEACREEGIVLGIYYSHAMDWHDPDSQGNTWDYPGNIGVYDDVESWVHDPDKRSRFERYLHSKSLPQVRELLTEYGKVGLMWFDCGGKLTREQGEQFLNTVYSLQPECLVNSRVWKAPLGDYSNTSDNQLATRTLRRDWENIITLNDSWGYKKSDHHWKSPASIIRQIIDVVSKNGNLVINIGPTGTGEWDPISEAILLEVGSWLDLYGESIYGAGASPTARPAWGRCTIKQNMLYLHVFDRPANNKLVVPGLKTDVQRVFMLEDGGELAFAKISAQDLEVVLPAASRTSTDTAEVKPQVIAVLCSGPVEGNPVRLLKTRDTSLHELGVFESEISGPGLKYDTGKKGRDNLLDWSDEQAEAVWSVRTLGPVAFDVHLEYGCGDGRQGGGGTFRITAGEQTLRAEVQPTGGPYDFREFYAGRLHFPDAGEYRIRLQAETIAGHYLMQPRCLKLQR